MDNYFILSPKVGGKWPKVTSSMTSVKLGTCIIIVETQFIWGKIIVRGFFHLLDDLLLGKNSYLQGEDHSTMSPWPFFHSHYHVASNIHITVPRICIHNYPCPCSWLAWEIEEASCHAHGRLKKQVVRPVSNSLSGIIVGNRFPEGDKLQLQCLETSGPSCCWSLGREVG